MFKHLFPVLLFPLILIGAGCAQTAEVTEDEMTDEGVVSEMTLSDGSYTLNVEESSVRWEGSKAVGTPHFGQVTASEGALMVQDGKIVGGTIVMDMSSIMVEDLEAGPSNESLVNHLKSDDFFGVETHPTAMFAVAEGVMLEGVEGANYRLSGEMTIKGIGNEVSFPAMIEMEEGELNMTAQVTVDRSIHDVRFGSGAFFEDLGDNLINDDFILDVDLTFEMGEGDADAEPSAMMDGEEEEMEEDDMGVEMDASVK